MEGLKNGCCEREDIGAEGLRNQMRGSNRSVNLDGISFNLLKCFLWDFVGQLRARA
jgi:hypothetical protein